jgi:hypothetical protein
VEVSGGSEAVLVAGAALETDAFCGEGAGGGAALCESSPKLNGITGATTESGSDFLAGFVSTVGAGGCVSTGAGDAAVVVSAPIESIAGVSAGVGGGAA